MATPSEFQKRIDAIAKEVALKYGDRTRKLEDTSDIQAEANKIAKSWHKEIAVPVYKDECMSIYEARYINDWDNAMRIEGLVRYIVVEGDTWKDTLSKESDAISRALYNNIPGTIPLPPSIFDKIRGEKLSGR